MQIIPSISVTNGTPTTLFPLSIVMIAVLIKDAYEEFYRYLKDREENTKPIEVWKNGSFKAVTW